MMNEYEIEEAVSRFTRASKPNRLGLALVVQHLAEWTNRNSDGWPYWQKPRNAAKQAIALIESRTYQENEEQERTDATDAEVEAAVRPIKAFLTRQKVTGDDREYILRGAEPVPDFTVLPKPKPLTALDTVQAIDEVVMQWKANGVDDYVAIRNVVDLIDTYNSTQED